MDRHHARRERVPLRAGPPRAGAPGDVEPRFVDLDGLPVIDGAIAQIACTIEDRVDAGDHTLFVGRVDALTQNDGDPLLYYQGSYGALERD